MFTLDHPQKNPLFDFYAPLGQDYRGLLSIPHSGENIPMQFEKYLSGDIQAYKEDVDFKVNELVDIKKIQESGVAVLVSHVHRICVDLNRAESNCLMFWKNNTQGKSLVLQEPDAAASQDLIEKFYHPYYEILKAALRDLEKRKSGQVSMVDLHSMPSTPTEYHMMQNPNQKMQRPDFCVSDRKGKTAIAEFTKYFRDHLAASGFEASLNDPYVGGYITEYVDQFRTNNIQIEIKRGIYMDEVTKQLVPAKVEHLRPLLTDALISGFKKFDS